MTNLEVRTWLAENSGFQKSKLIDNYIHSVLKTEENVKTFWVDNRLTTACQNGYILIYDEFNRSKPEANNALLSVLEEKILNLPGLRRFGKAIWKSIRISAPFSRRIQKNMRGP